MEHKRYHHPHVQICRTCKGTGKVGVYHQHDLLNMHAHLADCPTCLGSGRVSIKREITTTVVPYKPTT
jgi:hypothetical protein